MGKHFYLLLTLATLASASIPASAMENSVDTSRQRRSLKIAAKIPIIKKIPIAAKAHIAKIPLIGSLFGLHATPEIPHLGTYPIWKVHRYHGISLQPVPYPGERIPSNLPHPPILPGEAPSIVSVPEPIYAHGDAPAPPANEYELPASEHYPAPYSAALAPSDSYPPVYNAPLSSRDPRGPVSTEQSNSATAFASSGGTAGTATAFASSGSTANTVTTSVSNGGELDLSYLQTLLPPEMFSRVQIYASTPEGHERVNALLAIANNARKLKFNAARSIQGMFQRLFGGAGGSTDVALTSGTWTNIPEVYPAPQGIFNQFSAVGTGISGSSLPNLPEVPPLPEIPGLQTLPPPPKLPHINLPDISPLSTNGLGGSYVSIQLPQAPQPEEAYSLPSAPYAPAHEYGPPPEQYSLPAQQYSLPPEQDSPPAQLYSPHSAAYAPAQQYGPPPEQYSLPAQQYSLPPEQDSPPAQLYSPPPEQYSPPPEQYSPPSQQYSPPAQQYSPQAQQYSPPSQQYSPPSQQYSPPAQQNSPQAHQYSPPAQQYSLPAHQYSPPDQQNGPPAQQYSPPAQQHSLAEIPSTSYGTPVGPVYPYPQSSGSSSSTFFQAPQQTYGTPDASFAASETQEQYEGRNGEAQKQAEASDSQPQVPLKTTKLHRVQDSRPLRGEALRAHLDSQRGFRPSHQDQDKQTDNEIIEDGQN